MSLFRQTCFLKIKLYRDYTILTPFDTIPSANPDTSPLAALFEALYDLVTANRNAAFYTGVTKDAIFSQVEINHPDLYTEAQLESAFQTGLNRCVFTILLEQCIDWQNPAPRTPLYHVHPQIDQSGKNTSLVWWLQEEVGFRPGVAAPAAMQKTSTYYMWFQPYASLGQCGSRTIY